MKLTPIVVLVDDESLALLRTVAEAAQEPVEADGGAPLVDLMRRNGWSHEMFVGGMAVRRGLGITDGPDSPL